MVLLQLKDPLKLFVKRREFLPDSGFHSIKCLFHWQKLTMIQYRHLIPEPVDRTSDNAWLYKKPW